jgi:hypothetical protein
MNPPSTTGPRPAPPGLVGRQQGPGSLGDWIRDGLLCAGTPQQVLAHRVDLLRRLA